MKNEAQIVDQRAVEQVDIGATVTIRDTETHEQRTLLVGSYQVLDQQRENEVSYAAPLARPLLGATLGEEREVTIGDGPRPSAWSGSSRPEGVVVRSTGN